MQPRQGEETGLTSQNATSTPFILSPVGRTTFHLSINRQHCNDLTQRNGASRHLNQLVTPLDAESSLLQRQRRLANPWQGTAREAEASHGARYRASSFDTFNWCARYLVTSADQRQLHREGHLLMHNASSASSTARNSFLGRCEVLNRMEPAPTPLQCGLSPVPSLLHRNVIMSGTQGVLCRCFSVHSQRSTTWRAIYSTRSGPVDASAARNHLRGAPLVINTE